MTEESNMEGYLEKKHTMALKEKYSIEEDINKLFEAIEIGSLGRNGVDRCLEGRNHLSKRAMKRPMKPCPSQLSGIGISKPVSMKQALRGLCISQASEMAAAKKRMSRTSSSSSPRTVSEIEAIDKLYRAVVIKSGERGRLDRNDLLEISLVPESEQIGMSELASYSSSCNKLEQRFPRTGDNSMKEKRQIKHLASESGSSKTFNVEIKLLMSSRRSLMSRPRSRTQNFVKNKVVPKSQVHRYRAAKSGRDYGCSEIIRETSASGGTNEIGKLGSTVEASAISKIMKTDSVTSCPNIDKHGIIDDVSSKTVDAMTESQEKGEISQSSKSSVGEYCSNSGSRPHMSKNLRWEAINRAKKECGNLSSRHFKLVKKIGVGDIGTVYLSELIGTSCFFALKVVDSEFLSKKNKTTRAATEKSILEILDHPFLPTLYAHFKTEKFSCLAMDYCPGGDLHVLRQKQAMKCFPEKAARFYVAEVLLALEYLHMLGVVYRDLKPENILVREDGHIMLTDFDLSLMCNNANPPLLRSTSPVLTKKITTSSSPCSNSSCIDPFCLQPSTLQLPCFSPRFLSRPRKLKSELANQIIPLPQIVVEPTNARSNSFVGTHEYLAPEVIKGEGHGSSVDWWALGVLLYELLYGKTPFKGSTNEETISNVVSENLRFPRTTPLVSSHARDLMRRLLTKEPSNRLGSSKGAAEIKQHAFFEGMNWALIRGETPPDFTNLSGASKHSKSQGETSFDMF